MTEGEFWTLIERSRDEAQGDPDRQAVELKRLLQGRSAADLEAFDAFFDTARTRLYRWDCWEAGILIGDGMSDDGFLYFRAWVISRGHDVYERTLGDPDSLADLPEVHDRDGLFEAESFAAAAYHVYMDAFGEELDGGGEMDGPGPEGPELDEDGIKRALPRLWALGHR